jgi:SAM-dependent methyltransferase
MPSHDELANSFGPVADLYDRVRPGYPDDAIDWLLPPGARRVIDLGAGTGKLTAALVARGLDVVAVEPSDEMRAVLARAVPGAQALAGSGESIPLPDGSVDAVLVAQAWHWVDRARAVPEVARVLAPGGRLAMVWNLRDESVAWVSRLGALIGSGDASTTDDGDIGAGPPFGSLERFQTSWIQQLTPDQVVELAASRSYVITLSEHDRAAALHAVRDLLAHHPALAGRQQVGLPYVTVCARTHTPD